MSDAVERAKSIEKREHDKLMQRRKEAWKLLNEISPEIANDIKTFSFIFGKPKLINVETNTGKTWKWVN